MSAPDVTEQVVTPVIATATEAPHSTAPLPVQPVEVSLPILDGYEVLAMVGRGGMGRVFKARQKALGRIVAIKMLLDAGDDRLIARFHAESQAVARLQHPNIAQVFETGQVHGQPFLVLEFVDGGSLVQHLAGKPQPSFEAARLVETLARAMEHCHQHGIIHRDLKPGNILLAADGAPKITDFGLAKRLHENSNLTRTGEVLGTPSYMAPEQASGVTTQLGPGVDVYALGAILYEMLTGRPPFQGLDPVQTLMMVLTMDPVAPTRLLPRLPRDLETICLKCLEKSPRKRYANAVALADDLRRFIDGKPIVARPVSMSERAWKWTKRRPAMAAFLMLLCASTCGLIAASIQIYTTNHTLDTTNRELETTNKRLDTSNQMLGTANLALQSTNHKLDTSNRQLESANEQLKSSMRETEDSLFQAHLAIDHFLVRLSDKLAPLPQLDEVRRESLEDARKIYAKLAKIRAGDPERTSYLADALGKLGAINSDLGRLDDAAAAYRQALALHTDLQKQEPDVPHHRRGHANTLLNLANLEQKRGKLDKAESLVRAALAEIKPLLGDDEPTTLEGASSMYTTLGVAMQAKSRLASERGDQAEAMTDLTEAAAAHEAALKLRKQWLDKEPDSNDAKNAVAASLSNTATVLLSRKQPEKAVEALAEAEKMLAAQTSPKQRFLLGQVQANRAVSYEILKKSKESEAMHAAAIKTFDALVADYSTVPAYRFALARGRLNLARHFWERQRVQEAQPEIRLAGPIFDRLVREFPDNQQYRSFQKLCQNVARFIEEDLATARKKK
jgi:eukaryotic-like serine/threonine-protein kinase